MILALIFVKSTTIFQHTPLEAKEEIKERPFGRSFCL